MFSSIWNYNHSSPDENLIQMNMYIWHTQCCDKANATLKCSLWATVHVVMAVTSRTTAAVLHPNDPELPRSDTHYHHPWVPDPRARHQSMAASNGNGVAAPERTASCQTHWHATRYTNKDQNINDKIYGVKQSGREYICDVPSATGGTKICQFTATRPMATGRLTHCGLVTP